MSKFSEALIRFADVESIKRAQESVVSKPDDLELRMDIIRAYQFVFPDAADLEFIISSIRWIIENHSDCDSDGNWTEWQQFALSSDELKAQFVKQWTEKLGNFKGVNQKTLENAANFLTTVDMSLAVACRRELHDRNPLSFDYVFDYAHLLISYDLKTGKPHDPKLAFSVFSDILAKSQYAEDINVAVLTDACKAALAVNENSELKKWASKLEEKVKNSPPTEKHMFAIEPYAVLARSYLRQKNDNKITEYLSELEKFPVSNRGEFILYDKDIVTDLVAVQKKALAADYIEARFRLSESDQELKEEYLKLAE